MPPAIQAGQSDFPSLRRGGWLYVDKTLFVRGVLDAPAQVILYPRPRRFGKTLNMSMLQAFFEVGPDRSALFAGLKITEDSAAQAHFQRYPVVALTFKDIKQRRWEDAREFVEQIIADELRRHAEAIADPRLPADLHDRLERARTGVASPRVLRDLCEALYLHHGQQVVMLIDEYDAGILNAWEHGHYDEAVDRFRALYAPALKDNPFLFKGVLTGILRLARESMFSGLNNVMVLSLLSADQAEYFGFTETDVVDLLDLYDRSAQADEVRRWYNGYRFGRTTVYNPWSIISMLAFPSRELEAHWLNTSGNTLVRSLLLGNPDLGADITTLLQGGAIEARIEEDVPLRDLRGAHIWSLFLFSGYLRAERSWLVGTRRWASLTIPNFEVRGIWEDTFLTWLEAAGPVAPLHAAILGGDAPRVEALLGVLLLRHVSSHDVAATQEEAFYHAFVLGLLVSLEGSHAVRSNRETGFGRADVLVIPKRPGLPGVVLEFKRKTGRKRLVTVATEALAQIQGQAYTTELEAAGASPIRRLGIGFSGKEVAVRGEVG